MSLLIATAANRAYIMGIALLAGLTACEPGTELPPLEFEYPYPENYSALAGQEIIAWSREGVPVLNGGYGSAMAPVPGEEGAFFLLTDRGPVVKGAGAGEMLFVAKRFNPHIGKYKLAGDSMRRSSRILLKMEDGKEASGIPNPPIAEWEGALVTGETPMDTLGQAIAADPYGIDPEGLAVAADRSFWVSEEYGPYLLHFSSNGQLQARVGPFSNDPETLALPAVFARRQVHGGMTGLSFIPGTPVLAAIMAAPLNNPDAAAGSNSGYVRVLLFNTQTGESQTFLYPLASKDNQLTDIIALDANNFLVLEVDAGMPGDAANPARYKQVFRVSRAGATDITDPENSKSGKQVNGKTMEQLSENELTTAGIKTLEKSLVVDLLTAFPNYPHDKPEGMALINSQQLAVINDDDYGIRSTATGGNYREKTLPLTDTTDQGMIYFIDLPSPVLP